MDLTTKVYTLLSSQNHFLRNADLSADDLQKLVKLKSDIIIKVAEYAAEIKKLAQLTDEYVIKMWINDEFEGYVDYYMPSSDVYEPIITRDQDDVSVNIFTSEEEAEKKRKQLQEEADAFNQLVDDGKVIVYTVEKRR